MFGRKKKLPRIVHLRATVTGLSCAFIPFAVRKSDPLPDFQRNIEAYRDGLEGDANALTTIQEAWNKPFMRLTDEQIFSVCAWSAVPAAPPRLRSDARLSFAIATPGPLKQRWVTSFAVEREGELVAWSVPVDMRDVGRDEEVEVVFSEENMIGLGAGMLRDSAMQNFQVA